MALTLILSGLAAVVFGLYHLIKQGLEDLSP